MRVASSVDLLEATTAKSAPPFSSAAILSISSLVGGDDVADVGFIAQFPDRDLGFVHLLDRGFVDPFVDDARRPGCCRECCRAPSRAGGGTRAPRRGRAPIASMASSLMSIKLVEDLVELGRVDLELFVVLDQALDLGLELDVGDIDRLAIDQGGHGRRVGRGCGRRLGRLPCPPQAARPKAASSRRSHTPSGDSGRPCRGSSSCLKAVFRQSGLSSARIDTG